MAVELLNCLDARQPNKIIAGCCCDLDCALTNDFPDSIRITDLVMSAGDFSINNILIDGNPISYPIDINPGFSVSLSFSLCAPIDEQIGSIAIDVEIQAQPTESFSFDLESVLPINFISPTSIDFGNVAVDNATSVLINIPDELLCCNDFFTNTLSAPFNDTGGVTVCPLGGAQSIQVFFAPTSIGAFNDSLLISINECASLTIPITGNGIDAPPSGGNDVSGKRTVVDCPSGNCGLFNPQPGFAQTTKNSIQQISRATLPKGGPGRGTNFGKK